MTRKERKEMREVVKSMRLFPFSTAYFHFCEATGMGLLTWPRHAWGGQAGRIYSVAYYEAISEVYSEYRMNEICTSIICSELGEMPND